MALSHKKSTGVARRGVMRTVDVAQNPPHRRRLGFLSDESESDNTTRNKYSKRRRLPARPLTPNSLTIVNIESPTDGESASLDTPSKGGEFRGRHAQRKTAQRVVESSTDEDEAVRPRALVKNFGQCTKFYHLRLSKHSKS